MDWGRPNSTVAITRVPSEVGATSFRRQGADRRYLLFGRTGRGVLPNSEGQAHTAELASSTSTARPSASTPTSMQSGYWRCSGSSSGGVGRRARSGPGRPRFRRARSPGGAARARAATGSGTSDRLVTEQPRRLAVAHAGQSRSSSLRRGARGSCASGGGKWWRRVKANGVGPLARR